LLKKHPSEPQNPDIAAVFFRTGLIEAWGRGFERIVEACRSAGTTLPEVRHDGSGLWTEWHWQPPEVTPPATLPVTPPVEAILRLLGGGDALGNAALWDRLGLKDRLHLREHHIRPALEAGLIEMTIPDKPNSPAQKYRLTKKGAELLAAARKRGPQ